MEATHIKGSMGQSAWSFVLVSLTLVLVQKACCTKLGDGREEQRNYRAHVCWMLCPDFQLCNVNLPWLMLLRIPSETSQECSVRSLCECCLWCLKATKLRMLGELGLAWCLCRLPWAASTHPCLLILLGLLDRWDPLSAKLISIRLSNPLFVGNWNLRVNMPRRHLKRSLPNTFRFPFFKERCCLWPRTQRRRAWETGSFSSGVGLLCLPQVTPTPTIPACRTGHGFIYFSLAQFGSTGFLSCSEQPHTCVK